MKADKTPRILVVDDHEKVLTGSLCAFGEPRDSEVVFEAANGSAGVRFAEEFQPHVIVLEVSMLSLGGIEAARRIHQGCSKVAISLSQHNSEAIAQTALASGAVASVTKSAAPTALICALKDGSEGKKVRE